jgi:hypothetical protein
MRHFYEDEYVRHWHDYIHFVQPQSDWLVGRSGFVIVDHLLRYEQLDASLRLFSDSMSLGLGNLPWLNRADRGVRLQVSPKALGLIRKRYARDFCSFGYPARVPLGLGLVIAE